MSWCCGCQRRASRQMPASRNVWLRYRYFLVPTAPYLPPCLKGANLGNVSNFRSSKEGKPCSQSENVAMHTASENGGKILSGTGCSAAQEGQSVQLRCDLMWPVLATSPASDLGCPDHIMFKDVRAGVPFGMKQRMKAVRKLHNHASKNYGTCPAGAACGCGCGASACGCGCGTTACGCGCGATSCGCGCGATSCGCGATACGCGCGATSCGCGCGQMFCAMGLTKKTSAGTPVSLSQCNLVGHTITIDKKQDLSSYSLTFENGRMKVSAQRAFNTGDETDYVLDMDTPYYILLTVGVPVGDRAAIQVGYHGGSSTQTLVCTSTLREKGECRLHSNSVVQFEG